MDVTPENESFKVPFDVIATFQVSERNVNKSWWHFIGYAKPVRSFSARRNKSPEALVLFVSPILGTNKYGHSFT